jgi:hypothetical protein
MKQRGKLAVSVLLAVIFLLAVSGTANASSRQYRLGCKPSSEAVLQKQYNASVVNRLRSVRASAAIDWSSGMPTPGDQGQQGSCVAWSTGYNYKSYQEQAQHYWGLNTTHHLFSPAYIYNQIDGGQDNGAAIADALNLLVSQGCDTLDDMPYNQYNFTTQPTQAQRQRASYFPSQGWTPIFQGTPDISGMKSALANGPIVAGTEVYWSAGWETSGNIAERDVSGSPAGGHAICIVGYDDSHRTDDGAGAFKFINSWGTGWGNYGGYGWISYSYAQNNFFEAEVMYDKTATDTYSVSGMVVDQNQQPLAGVTIAFAKQGGTNPVPAAVTTDSNGKWSQSGFFEGTPYQLTPSKTGYTFTPASQNFSYDSMQPEVIDIQAGSGSQTTGITVTVPAGGENWQTGSTQTISWAYTGNPGSTIKLDLLQGGSLNCTIASSAPIGSNGSGSYTWAIPSSLAAGSNYQIQVSSTSTASCYGVSNSFTISVPAPPPTPATISVTAPAGGAKWQAGSTQTISWTYTGSPGSAVKIVLLNKAAVASTISSSTPIGSNGSGSYTWAIPSSLAAGSNYQIQVSSTSTASCYGVSNSFTISAPAPPPNKASITITYPRAGTALSKGQYCMITWKYTGNPGYSVRVDLLKGGALYNTIGYAPIGTNGSGYCSWHVSIWQAGGSNFQVRLTSTGSSSITSTSGYFSIGY